MSIYYVMTCLLMTSLAASGKQPDIRQQEDQKGYFQYLNFPALLQYEFGFNRGSPTHQVSRHEQFKNGNFRSKVKWSDSNGGLGGHYFDYNHGSFSADHYTPEYQTHPGYNPVADSKPAATQDAPKPIFDTLFRFPKPQV